MAGLFRGNARLILPAGKASPSPAIGQSLGQYGINMNEFCKVFNAETQRYTEGIPVAVGLTAYTDRSFKFTVKSPHTSWLIMQALGLDKGPADDKEKLEIHLKQVYEIAKVKQSDGHMSHLELRSLCRSVIGTARAMGIRLNTEKTTNIES